MARSYSEPRVSESGKIILENVLHVPYLYMILIIANDLNKKNYELTENYSNDVNVTWSKKNENISNIYRVIICIK